MLQLLQLPKQSATRNQAALEDMRVVVPVLSTQAKAASTELKPPVTEAYPASQYFPRTLLLRLVEYCYNSKTLGQ